jgi:hypothetical protein
MSGQRSERFGDKSRLSRRSRPAHREDAEVVAAVTRLIGAVAKRLAAGDPDGAALLLLLDAELDKAWAVAVAGWRDAGFSDSDIGKVLGTTKQAVQQRWPRTTGSTVAPAQGAEGADECLRRTGPGPIPSKGSRHERPGG